MKHLAAYLLLGLAGNTSPSKGDIKEVLGAVGIEPDEERLSTLLSELEGKDISEVRPPTPIHRAAHPHAHNHMFVVEGGY